MWVAKHTPECTDQTEYDVARVKSCVESAAGEIIDAEVQDGEVTHAECRCCYADAAWVA